MLGFGIGVTGLPVTAARFDPALLFAGGAAGAWYDPSDVASMAQQADGTGAAAVGLPVGRIADKSGNGNHAVQGAADARPVLRADGGGRLYLEFDGVDDFLRAAFPIGRPFDRVSAFRQTSWTPDDQVFGATISGTSGVFFRQQGGSPNLAMWGGSGSVITVSALPVGANGVVTERFDGANSRAAVNDGPYATGTLAVAGPGGITLGASAGGAGFAHIRLYGVLMIGRALSEAETGRLRGLMAAQAGVTL